jgi:4-hydroxybenzoate polyprenyltransferase
VPTMLVCYFGSNLCALVGGEWQFLLFNVAQHLLGCMYSAPIRIGQRTLRIKELPFIKNLYAALFWSFALMLTPFVYANRAVTDIGWIIAFVCFGMSYFVELSWDLRDVAGDRKANVRTVPIVMGIPFAARLLATIHVVTCVLVFWAVHRDSLSWQYGLIYALNLPVGLAYLRWYMRLADKTLGSHLYVLWLGVLFLAGTALLALR